MLRVNVSYLQHRLHMCIIYVIGCASMRTYRLCLFSLPPAREEMARATIAGELGTREAGAREAVNLSGAI